MLILVVVVIGGFVVYVMTPAERKRILEAGLTPVRRVIGLFVRHRSQTDPFRDALRVRTRWAVVTPALVALFVAIFFGMVFGRGAVSDPNTIVAWGGNFAPRTTNGEWWRLSASMFVHTGLLHLFFNIVGLVQIGLLVERLVGPMAFAAVFMAAGTLASAVSVEAHPVEVSAGAQGGVFGIYGLFLACALCYAWSEWKRRRSVPDMVEEAGEIEEADDVPAPPARLPISFRAIRDFAPAAGLFLLYHLAGGFAHGELPAVAVGFACGIVLAREVAERKPIMKHVAIPAAAMVVTIAAAPFLQPRVLDVRPEIARVVALEDSSTSGYDKAVAQFRRGTLSAEALALHIDKRIMPELRSARARLKALTGVPRQHQQMVANADEYLRLRTESWSIRAEALHKRSMAALKKAETPEREALVALKRIAPAEQR